MRKMRHQWGGGEPWVLGSNPRGSKILYVIFSYPPKPTTCADGENENKYLVELVNMRRKLPQITVNEKINKLKTTKTTWAKQSIYKSWATEVLSENNKSQPEGQIQHQTQVKKDGKNFQANYITKHASVSFIFIFIFITNQTLETCIINI